ncbi:ABC transporter permease [Caproiciproducens sp. R1]|uniref:ABC transporter permease n=1 Tax=Caproiciproducens sp. R1 TaxID=3435000 RepID=UPI00403340D4
MVTLWKQAVRGVWRGRKSYFACIVLLAMGIMVYVSYQLLYVNLSSAQKQFYASQRFADGFASVDAIPAGAVKNLSDIKGISRIDSSITLDARVMGLSDTKIVTLRLNSFDPEDPERLNNFVLAKGTVPESGGLLIGQTFAAANKLAVGDTVRLIVNGQEIERQITGIAQSPEYVYVIPDTGQLLPDDSAFGFAFVPAADLETLGSGRGIANRLSFLLEKGATFRQVEAPLREALEPYGLRSLTARKDQPSHAMLQQEIDQLGSMSASIPTVFIVMAVLILYIMLKRMIEQERMQIGTLKAFGFSNWTIVLHYLSYGGVTGAVGGVAGVLLGLVMTGGMTQMYLDYFSLPAIQVPPDPFYILMGLLIAVLSGLAGAFMGVRGVLRLEPGEAMRPPSPPVLKSDLFARLPLIRKLLTSYGFMASRNITRNKFRSTFVLAGMAFAFAITAFMASYGDMFKTLMLDQFTKVEVYDLKITLKTPTGAADALETADALKGVDSAEAILELPAELHREHLQEAVSLTALPDDVGLYRIYDVDSKQNHSPPKEGILLSSTLAKKLQAKRGDVLTVRTPYTGDRDIPLPVMGVVHTNSGSSAFASLKGIWNALDIPPTVNSILLSAKDPQAIKAELTDAKNVAAMTDQEEAKASYMDMFRTYSSLMEMMQGIGMIIAFAIITNTASISLSERKREYATMRVLGMHPKEIGKVVSFEYWVLSLGALPLGILLTRMIKQAMATTIDSDLFTMPLNTPLGSYFSAAVLCAATVALSNRLARRRISKFDMVEVLKERE